MEYRTLSFLKVLLLSFIIGSIMVLLKLIFKVCISFYSQKKKKNLSPNNGDFQKGAIDMSVFCYLSSAVQPQLLTVSIMSHSLMHSGSTKNAPRTNQRGSHEQQCVATPWSKSFPGHVTVHILQLDINIIHIIQHLYLRTEGQIITSEYLHVTLDFFHCVIIYRSLLTVHIVLSKNVHHHRDCEAN